MEKLGMKEIVKIMGPSTGTTLTKVRIAAQEATYQRKFINRYAQGNIGASCKESNSYYNLLTIISGEKANNVYGKIKGWCKAFSFNLKELKDVSNMISKSEIATCLQNIIKRGGKV